QVRLQRGQGHVHNRAVDKGHTGSEGCGYKHPAPGNFRTRRCSRTRANYALITRFLENWKHQLISYSLLQSKSRLEYSSRQPSYWHEPTNLAKGHAKHRLAGAPPPIFNIGSHQKPLRRRRECVLARTHSGTFRKMLQMRDNATRPDRNSRPRNRFDRMIVKLTNAERDTILAALRRWQSYPAAREADLIATNGGKHRPLDNAE